MNIRHTKLRAEMERQGLDAVWITSAENHLYFSGFDNPDGWMLITKTNAYVFADFRYIEAARRESYPECTVIMPQGGRKAYLLDILEENSVHTLGYEDGSLSCRAFHALEADLEGYELAPLGNALSKIRSVKTEEEIDCIERAQRIAEEAFEELLTVLTPEMTEIEAAAGGAGSARGTGGMVAKLQSARTVTEAGIPMIICSGDDPAMLYAILDGTFIGTYFEAKGI